MEGWCLAVVRADCLFSVFVVRIAVKRFSTNTFAPWYCCRISPLYILLFLWGVQQGESVRSLRQKVSVSGHTVSWTTLWNRLLKFDGLLLEGCLDVWLKVSRYRVWQTDEMYVLDMPVIGIVDPQTKQVFLTLGKDQKKETMANHFLRVVTRWRKTPQAWCTDGHASCPASHEKTACTRASRHSKPQIRV